MVSNYHSLVFKQKKTIIVFYNYLNNWNILILPLLKIDSNYVCTNFTLIVDYFSIAFYATISQSSPVINQHGKAKFDAVTLNIGDGTYEINTDMCHLLLT